jgi:hypothetical protein
MVLPAFYDKLFNQLNETEIVLPSFKTKYGNVRLFMTKRMTKQIADAIKPLFGDFYNGTMGYTHYEGALNCYSCWKFVCNYFLILNSEFKPLVSQLELPETFNELKKAIEEAPYSYEIKVFTNEKLLGNPSNTNKENITYHHFNIKISETEPNIPTHYLNSIQIWLNNVLAIETIASDLRQIETFSDKWDYFEEKLKNIPTINFFKWIRSFQQEVSLNERPYIETVIKYLFRTILITRDTNSKSGWLIKLPVWHQLRNTFMRAVIEANDDDSVSKDLKTISEKVVSLIQVWHHPTNLHKHSISEDGTVTEKTAKRMEKIIKEFNLDKMTGSFTTLDQALEFSGLSLDFRNLQKNNNGNDNGLLNALNTKKVVVNKGKSAWNGGLHSLGKNLVNKVGSTEFKSSMTLQQFSDTMKHLQESGKISKVEIDVSSKPPPAIMGCITSGEEHKRFFKDPELLSTCWTNQNYRVETLNYLGMSKLCVNGKLPVVGMITNNGDNLHFVIKGASPQTKCGIPSWRTHINSEWFTIIDTSKVGDFINNNVMLSTPEKEQLVCGVLESYNPKTSDFFVKPVLYITYANGEVCKVTLSGGSHYDKVWNKPEKVVPDCKKEDVPEVPYVPDCEKEVVPDCEQCGGGGSKYGS